MHIDHYIAPSHLSFLLISESDAAVPEIVSDDNDPLAKFTYVGLTEDGAVFSVNKTDNTTSDVAFSLMYYMSD
jgi:hypothetical protein